jgi:hypothetical protein
MNAFDLRMSLNARPNSSSRLPNETENFKVEFVIVFGTVGRRVIYLLNHLLTETLKRNCVKPPKQLPIRLFDFPNYV